MAEQKCGLNTSFIPGLIEDPTGMLTARAIMSCAVNGCKVGSGLVTGSAPDKKTTVDNLIVAIGSATQVVNKKICLARRPKGKK